MICIAAIVVGALVLFGGCGGGDDTATTESVSAGEVRTETSPLREAERADSAASDESPNETGTGEGDNVGESADDAERAGSEGSGSPSTRKSEANGGAESGSPSAPAGLSEAEFIAAADSICAEKGEEINKALVAQVKGRVASLTKPSVAQALVDDVWAPRLEAEIAELEALEGPAKVEKSLSAVISGIEDVIAEAKADPAAFAVKPQAFAKPEALAERYGFKRCGGIK